MTEQQLLEQFSQLLGDLLGDTTVALTAATRRTDVEGWDSFNYVNFIVAVEMELGIKFRVADVESFATVGDIAAEALRLLALRRGG